MWGMVPSSIQLWLSIGTRGPDDPEPSPQASSVTLRLLFGKLRIDMPHQAGCVRRCIPSCYSHVNSENHEKPMDFGTGLCSDNEMILDAEVVDVAWCHVCVEDLNWSDPRVRVEPCLCPNSWPPFSGTSSLVRGWENPMVSETYPHHLSPSYKNTDIWYMNIPSGYLT